MSDANGKMPNTRLLILGIGCGLVFGGLLRLLLPLPHHTMNAGWMLMLGAVFVIACVHWTPTLKD